MLLDPDPRCFPDELAVAWGEDRYGLWQAIDLAGERQVLRWIAPGSFTMGSPETEAQRGSDEVEHRVTLSGGYWLAETAVTQALWQAVTGSNPAAFDDDLRKPVEQVSWDDCVAFIERANGLLGGGLRLRLPSEAEWEYACRAGSTTAFSWGDTLSTAQANYDGTHPYAGGEQEEYRQKTVAVDEFVPNAWGLYQMHGNVWEWCADWYGAYPQQAVVDPEGPVEGRERVLRGGSWINGGPGLRSAQRDAYHPGARSHDFGLRLAGG